MSCASRSDEWGPEWGHPGYRRIWFWHPGWIVLTVLGFVLWWPVGLAILFFTLWGRRMSCWSGHGYEHWPEKMERVRAKMERLHAKMERFGHGGWAGPSSGNRAFDEYRSQTLQRLEEEQREFREFLQRLRMAKDKAEFDEFMAERRNRPEPQPPQS
ncbi:MAG TPA: DUF2852 domain-containing protein [Xanthobacteraceae bacterium]